MEMKVVLHIQYFLSDTEVILVKMICLQTTMKTSNNLKMGGLLGGAPSRSFSYYCLMTHNDAHLM